jgi:hypothetical protein
MRARGRFCGDILKDEKVNKVVQNVFAEVEWLAKKCNKCKDDNFSNCSKVWTQSRETFINELLPNGGWLSERNKLTGQQVWKKRELERFSEQVDSYLKSQNDIGLI